MKVELKDGKVTAEKMGIIPFTKRSTCPKCDARECYSLERMVRQLLGQRVTAFNTGHCDGGKEPETEHEGVIPMIRFVQANPCYGHADEHLHRQCRYCGYVLLMEVRHSHS